MSAASQAPAMRRTIDPNTVANRLGTPPSNPPGSTSAQSLADGAAGIALLHTEIALSTGNSRHGHRHDADSWVTAHRWLAAMTSGGVLATVDTSLYRGAPAVAFALHSADTDHAGRYATARHAVDRAVTRLTHQRVDQALERVARAEPPRMTEYDVISGLTGIGAHLLRHRPADDALGRVLSYLVRLTEPLRHDGERLPGWWTSHDPHATMSPAFPGGHANLGLAHGITGPLALLALAQRRGVLVDGQAAAIEHICAWLDSWLQHDDHGPWWPQWITHHDRRAGRPTLRRRRPSWCYGAPGIARSQQLASLAIDDAGRRALAERALMSCLAEPQLERITDVGLCHGWAGLLLTAWRTAADATPATAPVIADRLPDLADRMLRALATADLGGGLLDGRAGAALVHHAVTRGVLPSSGWDACLLIT